MKQLHIAIVTYNWPPRNAIGTHRPYAWAKYWSERGAEVTVITAKKQPYDEPLDLCLPTLENVKVIEVAYSSGRAKVGSAVKNAKVIRLLKFLKKWLSLKFNINFDVRDSWRRSSFKTAVKIAEQVDVVVSTFGPASCHFIASDMKKRNPKLFWLADYRDLWSQGHLLHLTESQRKRLKDIEVYTVGKYCDLISAVSKDMVNQLSLLTGKKVLLVPNGFDFDEEKLTGISKGNLKSLSKPMRIVYTGMLYNDSRNPEPLLEAIFQLCKDGLIESGSITLDFYGSRVDLAERLAENNKYASFIRIMGHVTRDKALSVQCEADLLLVLESSDEMAKGVLTGKVFEYMVTNTPIICLGSKPEYELPSLIKKTGTGISVGNDIDRIKQVILSGIENRSFKEIYNPNVSEIVKYSRRRQSLNLYSELYLDD